MPNKPDGGQMPDDKDQNFQNEFTSALEVQRAGAMAREQFEIQSAMAVARKFPRDEDETFARLSLACERYSFADKARYHYPRGNTEVSGASIYLAREIALAWGHVIDGFEIIYDDEENRKLRAWAWDLQTNHKVYNEVIFRKLQQRKIKGADGKESTKWVIPDERDLKDLTNKRAAEAKRNCMLELFPWSLKEDLITKCKETIQKKATADPEGERKKIISAFASLHVSPSMLEKYLTHPLAESSPSEIADLRAVYKSIVDGNSKWSDYVSNGEEKQEQKKEDKPTSSKLDKVMGKGKPDKPKESAKKAKPQTESEQEPPSSQDDAEFDDDDAAPPEPLKQSAQPDFKTMGVKQLKSFIRDCIVKHKPKNDDEIDNIIRNWSGNQVNCFSDFLGFDEEHRELVISMAVLGSQS